MYAIITVLLQSPVGRVSSFRTVYLKDQEHEFFFLSYEAKHFQILRISGIFLLSKKHLVIDNK